MEKDRRNQKEGQGYYTAEKQKSRTLINENGTCQTKRRRGADEGVDEPREQGAAEAEHPRQQDAALGQSSSRRRVLQAGEERLARARMFAKAAGPTQKHLSQANDQKLTIGSIRSKEKRIPREATKSQRYA